MIPASYLYKNAYRQAWIDPEPELKIPMEQHRDGQHIWDSILALAERLFSQRPTFHPVRQIHPAHHRA